MAYDPIFFFFFYFYKESIKIVFKFCEDDTKIDRKFSKQDIIQPKEKLF